MQKTDTRPSLAKRALLAILLMLAFDPEFHPSRAHWNFENESSNIVIRYLYTFEGAAGIMVFFSIGLGLIIDLFLSAAHVGASVLTNAPQDTAALVIKIIVAAWVPALIILDWIRVVVFWMLNWIIRGLCRLILRVAFPAEFKANA
jgi:flagellar biosynthesis protein FliQ